MTTAAGRLFLKEREMMKTFDETPSKRGDPEVEGMMVALVRAARRAHQIAHQTGTGVVVMRDGEVVEIEPDPEMYEGL